MSPTQLRRLAFLVLARRNLETTRNIDDQLITEGNIGGDVTTSTAVMAMTDLRAPMMLLQNVANDVCSPLRAEGPLVLVNACMASTGAAGLKLAAFQVVMKFECVTSMMGLAVAVSRYLAVGRFVERGSSLSRRFIVALLLNLMLKPAAAVRQSDWSIAASVAAVVMLLEVLRGRVQAVNGCALLATTRWVVNSWESCRGNGHRPGSIFQARASMATGTASFPATAGGTTPRGTPACTVQQFEGGSRRLGASGGTRLEEGAPHTSAAAVPPAVRMRIRCRLRTPLPSPREAARGGRLRRHAMEAHTSWMPTSKGTARECRGGKKRSNALGNNRRRQQRSAWQLCGAGSEKGTLLPANPPLPSTWVEARSSLPTPAPRKAHAVRARDPQAWLVRATSLSGKVRRRGEMNS